MIRAIAYVALGGAVVTAALLARRERVHAPVAAFLALSLAASLTRAALAPIVDTSRAAYHVSQASFLLDLISLLAAAIATFWRPVYALALVPVWMLSVGALVLGYDYADATALARFYLATEAVCVLGCVAVMAPVVAAWARSRAAPTIAHLCLALVVATELAGLALGPWRYGLWARWDLAQWSQVVLYATLTLLQGGVLLSGRHGPTDP